VARVVRAVDDAELDSTQRVVDAARNAGVRVTFFRHMSLPKELMGVFQLRMAMAWQRVESVDEVRPWFCPTHRRFN
jgi:hypothetical protein